MSYNRGGSVVLNVRVSPAIYHELQRIATKKDDTVSNVVRDLLDIALAVWVHSDKISLQDVIAHALPMIYEKEIQEVEKLEQARDSKPGNRTDRQ